MKTKHLLWAFAALTTMLLTACSNTDDSFSQDSGTLTPIRISAGYEGGVSSKTSYSESGTSITATWDAGDQLYVCYNGKVNTLSLTDGAGTSTATFEGSIIGTPTSNSVLICYVKDAKNPSAVTVSNTGEYTYSDGTFLSQDGTLEGAAKCNLYYGTTTYGTGDDLSCTFSVNTSMMKFTVYAPDDVNAGDDATLTYKSGDTEVSKASFTVGASGNNTVYLTIPAGQYTGAQTLVYKSGDKEESETLSATKATFKAGQTYSKTINYGSFAGIDLSLNGTANCYIVSEGGTQYRFDATVKGNGGIDPLTGTTATSITGIAGVKVLWEVNEYGKAIAYDGTKYDISTDGSYVYFTTPETFQQGAAYVAVVDNDDSILWSWLIWSTVAPSETEYSGLTIMDRNLGALGTGNVSCRGLMYEWGRKDPFPCPDNGSYTPISFAPARMTAFNIIDRGSGFTVAYTIANPTTYPSGSISINYWQTEDEYTTAMWWSGAKTIYDPCPVGWKVPSATEMNTVLNSGVNVPGNGFIGDSSSDFGYGNPGTRYYWTSTGVSRTNASSIGDCPRPCSGQPIRPVRE